MSHTTSSSIHISPPTFEHHHSGFGIQHYRPRISWRFSCSDDDDSDTRDWEQCAYDLEIGLIDTDNLTPNTTDRPKTFHIESQQSILTPWPSDYPDLRSRDRRRVRVRCYGTSSAGSGTVEVAITDWSEWRIVEAALLDRSDWTGELISPAEPVAPNEDGSARPLCFRRTFGLGTAINISAEGASSHKERKLSHARLYVTAHGVYHAYINGERVGDQHMAPGWQSYNKRLHYQVYDVTSLLDLEGGSEEDEESNVIGIEVGPGWYASALSWAHRRFTYGEELGVLAQLEVTYTDGSTRTVCETDEPWRCFTSSIISSEIYAGEVFDQSVHRDMDGWFTFASYNAKSWWPVKASPLSTAVAPLLVSPDAPTVRVTQRITPLKIFTSPSGKTLVDFGQNLVGRIYIRRLRKVSPGNSQSPVKVIFRHAEVLEDGELCTRPLRGAKATDTIICNGDVLVDWTPKFTFHGFRYVEITGWTTTDKFEPLTPRSIFAEVLHSDMQRTGWFSCSNDDVNKLHENARWSMRGNFLGVPTDCPQRDERMGWTGDVNVFTPSANFLYNTAGVLRHWLDDLREDQMDESEFWRKGVVPFVVPNCIQKKKSDDPFWDPTPNAVWADVAIMTPWELYNAFGDIEILKSQYESMKAYLKDGVSYGQDGLWDEEQCKCLTPFFTVPGFYECEDPLVHAFIFKLPMSFTQLNDDVGQFGDWLDPSAPTNDSGRGRTDGTYVADAFLLHVHHIMIMISSVLDYPADHKSCSATLLQLQKTFTQKYTTQYGLVVPDTPTALALALHFFLIPPTNDRRRHAATRLARHIRSNPYKIPTGFAGTPSLLEALTHTGNIDLAYALLLEKRCPSFLYPIHMGATTIWERWDSMLPNGSINPGSMTSFNHYALGSVVAWLYSRVGGIHVLEPGWKTFLLRPVVPRLGELTSAEVVFEGPHGRIEVRWMLLDAESGDSSDRKDGGGSEEFADVGVQTFRLVALVPPNSRAKIVMPDRQKALYLDHGMEEHGVWVGSGRHVFDCMLAKGDGTPSAILPPWGKDPY